MGDEREGLSFTAFVISLASTAAVHFGDRPDPATGQMGAPDLPAASQLIGILEMLQEKTRGNLSPTEQQIVDQVVYELRLRFVEASNPSPGSKA